MKRECAERLASLVGAGERVQARGTAVELRGPDDEGSGEWRFLLVTDERVLSAHWGHPDRPHEDIAFESVTGWADGSQSHRYLVLLSHGPLTRSHVGLSLFGRRLVRRVTRTSTVLRFSRRDTVVASALRAALSARGAPRAELALRALNREERTRGSRAELKIRF